jgi:hypothetical protein
VNRHAHDFLLGCFQRGEFLDHLALSRHQNAIGPRRDLGQIARDHHHRLVFVRQPLDQLGDLDDRADIDAAPCRCTELERCNFEVHRHIPRMRAPTSSRTLLFAARAAVPVAESGQLVFSNKPSSRSGMKRVRDA